MKPFQSLLASFVLVFAFAATTAAGDGIIHTGNPGAQPSPTPTIRRAFDDDGLTGGETGGGETTTLDLVIEAALDCLQVTLTLF